MSYADLPWDDVRLFLTLYRARTMGEAAKNLKINISTISRRLIALEEALDTRLFDRGREGLRATQAAHDLIAAAELVEHGVAQFSNAIDGLEREISGVVRLACPPDAADVLVLPMLKGLLTRHPQLRISLQPGESVVDLNRREADLALRIVKPTRGDLLVRKVGTVKFLLAAHPELASRLTPVTSLARLPWVGWGDQLEDSPLARWMTTHMGTAPVISTDSLRTQIAAAASGLGVALVPHPSVGHYGLVPLALPETISRALPQTDLFLVTHQSLRHVPRVKAVWEALLDTLSGI
ncbi:MAG: LysR family transcriptional regulator [Bradymonadia bacterium]